MSGNPIHFSNVSKSFKYTFFHKEIWKAFLFPSQKKNNPILDSFNLNIGLGEKVLICGENGRGKTTLLKLAAGILRPCDGNVRVNGLSAGLAKSEIGVMLGHLLLCNELSGFENLMFNAAFFGMANPEKRVGELVETWGLEEFIDQPFEKLSKGQRTLLALARSTIQNPSVLLWDEPHMFLSPQNLERLFAYIRKSSQTILMTAPTFLNCDLSLRIVHL